MTYQLVKGWWAIQDAVHWKVPMFELTKDLIKKVDDDDVYEFADGTKGFSLGRKSYFVKETKDERISNPQSLPDGVGLRIGYLKTP